MLAWWYRVSAPADAPPGATFAQRDVVRRARIASAVMLFLAIILVAVAAIGFFGPNKQILYTALIVWVAIGIGVVLNRRKHVNLVGLLLCLSINTGMYLSILRAPGGLGLMDKDILYLLVFSELFIGAILPSPWITVPLVINLLFSTYELFFAPHAADLAAMSSTSLFTMLIRVFQVHLFIAGVLWILNSHARSNTQRANMAEETARLHHDMATLRAQRDQDAQSLQEALAEIEATLTQAVSGKLNVRVANQQGGKFWALGGMLNGLLTRYERAVVDAREVQTLRLTVHQHKASHHITQRLTQEQALLKEAVAQALYEQRPFVVPEQLVLLEPFFSPLQGYWLLPSTTEPARAGVAGALTPTYVSGLPDPATLPTQENKGGAHSLSATPLSLQPQQQFVVPASFSSPMPPFHATHKEIHDDRQYL
ncbi:hypothetical protein KSX_67310 [Ktedonospora formicarum]|uniref:HAMP domain-containing protein n=2 Tax=Ktedonospora formicarum TaxID=2778364 RepID=A0A8J3MWE6_9CHLR|nr:hypothetical protein KSX_67310 [Ktedonospora formicarum]